MCRGRSTSTGSCGSKHSGSMSPRFPTTSATGATRPGSWHEAWTGIAAIAARTSTIRLTTCVTQMPLRNPAVLAHQAVTVDQISGGRLELGIGTGLTIDPSYDMIGVPNWSTGERVARFAEYHRAARPTARRGRHHLSRHLLPGQRSGDEPRLGAAATVADHGRRTRSADDAPCRRSRRHLEQLELRGGFRRATRRVERPLHDD